MIFEEICFGITQVPSILYCETIHWFRRTTQADWLILVRALGGTCFRIQDGGDFMSREGPFSPHTRSREKSPLGKILYEAYTYKSIFVIFTMDSTRSEVQALINDVRVPFLSIFSRPCKPLQPTETGRCTRHVLFLNHPCIVERSMHAANWIPHFLPMTSQMDRTIQPIKDALGTLYLGALAHTLLEISLEITTNQGLNSSLLVCV
jgi:hypothetical protein